MTRLVLIHGINQGGSSADELVATWLDHLRRGWDEGHPPPVEAAMAYFGDVLRSAANGATAMSSVGGTPYDGVAEAAFVLDALAEITSAAGVPEAELAEERRRTDGAAPMGLPMGRRIAAAGRLLERLSPFRGALALMTVREAYAYLRRPAVAAKVDAIVRPHLRDGPAVVVAHSLGSVVAFKLLREAAAAGRPGDVPLLVTAGSPLALAAVRGALGPEFRVPSGVERWTNVVNPDDLVSLGRGLEPPSFEAGVANVRASGDFGEDPHGVAGYLSDPAVAAEIAAACGGGAPPAD